MRGLQFIQGGQRDQGGRESMNHIGWKRGEWKGLQAILVELGNIQAKHAADYHDKITEMLAMLGWVVKREYPVVLPNETGGRVDIVADHRLGFRIALELDNRSPRGKSIIKLGTFPEEVQCAVILRNPR